MGRDTKLFVRGVSERIGTGELREVFEKYGRVVNVQTGQAGYAFIEMEEERDVYACIHALDGSIVDGQKIIVEKAREKSYREDRDRRDRDRDRDRSSVFRCYNCSEEGHLARDCKAPPRNPLYADTRGTRVSEVTGDGRRDDRDRDRDRYRDGGRYGRDYDRYGRDRDYRDYRDDRDRDRRSYDPRFDRDREYRDRDYDPRRSPSRYSSSSYRDDRDRDRNYSPRRRAYSPRRSPERFPSYRERRSSRSRSPDRSYRSRSPPRDRPRTPPDARRDDKDDKAPSPREGNRTPPDTL